ncbi:hypothetical protein WBJ53_14295 [Spirosoma sp. SC4-14]|uniref:hypothetical protein n=1 Tax=Spirosoma sp. SC4-14 TaxID=3128900 RepID=UPI0030CF4365
MGQYKANSLNSQNFSLTFGNKKAGELIYKKWYSFDAEILLSNGKKYRLEPKGFWDSKIELKDESQTLLEFKMGWKGILIKTFFDNKENTYLLTLKGLLSNKFVLLDTNNSELMVAETEFKWNKLSFDYTIETTSHFDNFGNNELLLLTILHCINYYMTITVAAA